MTDIKLWLQQIKDRLNQAKDGPWHFVNSDNSNRIESWDHRTVCKGGRDLSAWDISPEDGEFIAHAREDLDKLVIAYEKLLEETNARNRTVLP